MDVEEVPQTTSYPDEANPAPSETADSDSESTPQASEEDFEASGDVASIDEQLANIYSAVVYCSQQSHQDFLTAQTEIINSHFGTSMLLCGVICAVVIFRGFFHHD